MDDCFRRIKASLSRARKRRPTFAINNKKSGKKKPAKRKPGPCGPGSVRRRGGASDTFQRGTAACIRSPIWEDGGDQLHSSTTRVCDSRCCSTTREGTCQPCGHRTFRWASCAECSDLGRPNFGRLCQKVWSHTLSPVGHNARGSNFSRLCQSAGGRCRGPERQDAAHVASKDRRVTKLPRVGRFKSGGWT